MFIDLIYRLFSGCSNPIEYVLVLLMFYMGMEFVARIVCTLFSFNRRV